MVRRVRRSKRVKMETLLSRFRGLINKEEVVDTGDIWEPFETFLWNSMVPEKTVGNDRPCVKKDFVDYIPLAEVNFKLIESLLNSFNILEEKSRESNIKLKKSVLVSLLILCCEHVENQVWTSDRTRELVGNILLMICERCKCQTVKDLLVKEKLEEGINKDALFKPCLLALRPKLLKDTWKAYPAAVTCFCWFLQYVKSPHLGDYLGMVLPTALLLTDDFIPENRLQGIKCLHHIIDNVARSQLSWHGQTEVVYGALFTLLYHREEELMESLLKCITLVLEKLESGPDGAEQRLEWSRYDAVVQVILDHMAVEDKLSLRRIYAQALAPLLRAMGPAVARWLRHLTVALKHYFETAIYATEECTMAALEVLRAMEDACPERLPTKAATLCGALMRLLVDMKGQGPTAPVAGAASPALVAAANDALRRMTHLHPAFANSLAKTAPRLKTARPVQEIIRDIIAPTVAAIASMKDSTF